MTNPSSPGTAPDEYDPVFLHARREAWVVLGVWFASLCWVIPVCVSQGYLFGGKFDLGSFKTVFGMPAWVFWGIAIPWVVADVVTTWFCFGFMKNDDLGEANEGEDIREEVAEMHASERKGQS